MMNPPCVLRNAAVDMQFVKTGIRTSLDKSSDVVAREASEVGTTFYVLVEGSIIRSRKRASKNT